MMSHPIAHAQRKRRDALINCLTAAAGLLVWALLASFVLDPWK